MKWKLNMSQYFYFDVTLDIEEKISPVTAILLKNHVTQALKSLFGEVGSAIEVDVMKFDSGMCRAILRCPSKFYVKVHSSLTLCGHYEHRKCVYRIHKISPCLISLLSNSRQYDHN